MLLASDFSRITDSAGNPINGASATFYVAGTTTLATVYSSASLAIALPNPVYSDDAGLLQNIYGDDAVSYDIVFKDDIGAVLKTIEDWSLQGVGQVVVPISGASTNITTAASGKLVKRTNSGAMTDTLPPPGQNGRVITVWDASSFTDTLTVSGGGTINGGVSYVLQAGQRAAFTDDGTEWITGDQPLTTGKRFLALGAAYLTPATTNGCSAVAQIETATHKVNVLARDFSNSATKYGCQSIQLPPSYNGLSFEWRCVWTISSGAAGQTLRWGLQAQQYIEPQSLDSAWGAASTVEDTVIDVLNVHTTGWVTVTPANAGVSRYMAFRIYRDSAFGTHAADARLMELHFRPVLILGNDS